MAQPRESHLVTVIALNFNGRRHLRDCLTSLVAQTYEPLEIFVADNGSIDGSEEEVAQWPVVRWLPLGSNHGFAGGNNLAAEHARGEFIVFVNNDMRFSPDFVASLVGPLLDDGSVFATDARQRDWEDTRDVHPATFFRRVPLSIARGPGQYLPRYAFQQEPTNRSIGLSYIGGGSFAVRRSMFEDLGGLDAGFPAAWEDVDVCWRAALRGWPSLFAPDAICWHRVGGSSSDDEGARIRYAGAQIGALLFSTKHLPVEDVILAWCAELLGVVRDFVSDRGRGRGKARMKTFGYSLRHLPGWISERWRLHRSANTSARAFTRRMVRIGREGRPRAQDSAASA